MVYTVIVQHGVHRCAEEYPNTGVGNVIDVEACNPVITALTFVIQEYFEFGSYETFCIFRP